MIAKKKIQYLILIIILIIFGGYFFKESKFSLIKSTNFNSFLNEKNKKFIKKYFLPYKLIAQQERLIKFKEGEFKYLRNLLPYLLDLELEVKDIGTDIRVDESNIFLSNNKNLKKYKLNLGFFYGIHSRFPGSGYIDFYKDNIFVISSRGVLAYSQKLIDKSIFKQIDNNINEFIGLEEFKKDYRYSLKDLFIFKNKIFVSYIEVIKKDNPDTLDLNEECVNTSILVGDINYEKITFKRLFSSQEAVEEEFSFSKCIPVIGKGFQPHQSGGRIINFDNDHILFSLGEYRYRFLAQNEKSINGKIIKIKIDDGSYKIISMGHRNPQGLYFDKKNNFILETEHGPQGGDEINLIDVKKLNSNKIQNYGWPISSAGEHYGGRVKKNEELYKKYPLYDSHIAYGFIEPIKSFVPSIGISEIVKIKENKYVASSLKDKSLYFFELNKNRKLIDLKRVEVFERIRDLKYKDNKLYLFMEGTASIGVISYDKESS